MDGLRDVVALRKYVGVARPRCSLEVKEDEVVYQRNDEYYVPMSLLMEPWIRSGLSIANITAYRSGCYFHYLSFQFSVGVCMQVNFITVQCYN